MTPLEQIIERLNSVIELNETVIELNENTLKNKLRSNIERSKISYTLNVLKYFKTQVEEMLEEERRYINKSEKWDKLEDKIKTFIKNDVSFIEEDGNMTNIRDVTAKAFGFI